MKRGGVVSGIPAVAAVLVLVSLLVSLLSIVPHARAAIVTVTVFEPHGGELWSGGSVHTVRYRTSSNSGNPGLRVWITYVADTGSGLVVDPGPGENYAANGNDNAYDWTLPSVDLTNATVTVCALDLAGGSDCKTSPAFTVDGTPPMLQARGPEGTNIGLDEPIAFEFSEAVNVTKAGAALSITPTLAGISITSVGASRFRVDHAPFAEAMPYRVAIGCGAVDLGDPGNPLAACPVSWTFTTDYRPRIAVRSPAMGDSWSGGSVHTIRWDASDREDPVDTLSVFLESSMDDGITWVPLAGPLAGDATYGWTVPTADVTAARVRAEVLDVRGLTANASSVPFAIDSTPPTISSISPADGAVDAEWTEPIIATFSEDVVGPLDAATIGIQTASGEWVTGAASWDSPSVFRFTPAAPLHASTAYIAHLNGTLRDLSDPGNALTAATWGFSTKANSGPTIRFRMILPAVLSGGSGWTLSWTSSDPDDLSGLLSVHLEYSDGGPFELIGGPLAPSGSLSWTVPAVDVANATLRVRVIDSQGGEANATVTFGIDATPPTIASASPPAGASNVPPNATVRITFSEPVDSGTASVGLRAVATGAWIPVTVAWVDALTMQLVPAILLREGRAYAVVLNGTLSDQSSPGNVLAPSSWTFRVAALPPSLTLVSPASGIRWTAGAPQTIRVRAADAQDATVTVSAAIATDGITFAPIMGSRSMAGGESTFPVTPPSVDAPSAVLRVCATDWDGASACSVLGLALDGTPPTIMETVPASGARRVLPDAAIVLTFSESMNRASVEDAIHIDPAVPVTFRWARGTFEDDTVFVDHARFAQTQTYTVIVRCDAADASAPGLPMRGACPLAITLTTASGPQVRITFPVGGERLTGGVDQKVRWIAGAEEPVVRAIAELSTDGGLSFPVSLSDAFVPTGETEVHATFPAIDTAAAVVRVNAIDSLGQITSAMSASFAIDSTPPRLLSSSPANGTAGVSQQSDIVLVFSEPMAPLALDSSSLAATPPLQSPWSTWSSTSARFDTLRIVHARFYNDVQTITLHSMRDASSPGNAVTVRVAFGVFLDHEVPRITMRVDRDAMEGHAVPFDASGSTDNVAIANLTWTVRDAGGFVLGTFRGAKVAWPAAKAGPLNVTLEAVDTSGNVARQSAPLYVHGLPVGADLPPNATVTFLGWLALAGAGSTSSYGFTDRGRSFLARTVLLPFYVKVKGEAVVNQETRGMIRGYIRVHPGDCYTDIKRNLGLANGELAYHLSVLEREGIVWSTARGARRLYYPREIPPPIVENRLHEVQQRIINHVGETPGLTVRELAGVLGLSTQLTLYHVRKLVGHDYVRLERKGVRLAVFPRTAEERLRIIETANS